MSTAGEVVQPGTLLQELDALWGQFGKENEAAENGLLRACSLTWIAVIEGGDASVTAIDTMLSGLMRTNPGRAIVVLLRDEDHRGLKGSVSAQCWQPFGSKQQVCIERVLLDTTHAGACDIPGVMRALIVADLPVVMFCPNAHLLSVEGITETAKLADRVVVDMAWRDASCHDVWQKTPDFGRFVSDLAWDRIRVYRKAIAEHFEARANRKILDSLRRIRVATRPDHPTPEAAYLLAWTLGSLGYQPEGGLRWRKGDATIEAGFSGVQTKQPSAAGPGIERVEFVAEHQAVHFSVNTRELSVEGSGGNVRVAVPVAAFETDTVLLSEEMMLERRRRTFEHHLKAAIHLFEEPVYLADE